MEATNGQFVRFADDIVAVTGSHDDALQILQSFSEHGFYSGISINHEKSPGIGIFASTVKSEQREFFVNQGDGGGICLVEEFDYIGHKFMPNNIGLSCRELKRTKRRVAKIIYIHLLYNLKSLDKLDYTRARGPHFDWDLVTCVNEVRKFIYGSLKQAEIASFLQGTSRIGRLRGFIGFCPLMDSVEQFRELDGWLVSVMRRALAERYRLIFLKRKEKLHEKGNSSSKIKRKKVPSKKSLLSGEWYNGPSKLELELGLPSFAMAWRTARKKYKQYGLDDFENPKYYSLASGFPVFSEFYEN